MTFQTDLNLALNELAIKYGASIVPDIVDIKVLRQENQYPIIQISLGFNEVALPKAAIDQAKATTNTSEDAN